MQSVKCPHCKSNFDAFDVTDGQVQCPNCGKRVPVDAPEPAAPAPRPRVQVNNARVIAFTNHKSDVGKTASVISIGAVLQNAGKRVLLVDLDPQAQLTYGVGVVSYELDRTIYEVLKGQAALRGVVMDVDDFCVVPSSLDLSGVEMELAGIIGREFLLKKNLADVSDFDYILVDCPSSLGLLTLNALVAADEIFVPIQTELLALQSMAKLTEMLEIVKNLLNPALDITGVIATRFHEDAAGDRDVLQIIKDYFGRRMFKTVIRDDPVLAEAMRFGQTVIEYRPDTPAACDYTALAREIVSHTVFPDAPDAAWELE